MSTENERDTHFQEFAKLLWEEMLSQRERYYIDVSAGHLPLHHPEDEEHQEYIQIIARRAYDLVEHTLKEVNYYMLDGTNPFEWAINSVPDMTSFPN